MLHEKKFLVLSKNISKYVYQTEPDRFQWLTTKKQENQRTSREQKKRHAKNSMTAFKFESYYFFTC